MKRFFCIICVFLIVLTFSACGNSNTDNATPDSTVAAKSSVKGVDSLLAVQTFSIDTPFCEVKYPSAWEDSVSVKQETDKGFALCFYLKTKDKNVRVFDLAFNSQKGALLGTLQNTEKDTLSIIDYDLNSKDFSKEQLAAFAEMRDDINVTIANLEKDYDFKRE